MTEALTARRQESNYGATYRIAYDGRILGDSRGYGSEQECMVAIENELAKDARDAIRYARPLLYHKG